MIKVLPLKGYKSLRAWNAFQTLLLGLKMLPAYLGEHHEAFYNRIQDMPPKDQEKMIREAAHFVVLEKDEVEALVSFCADQNGVPYSAANVSNLSPKELIDIIVAVCVEMSKMRIDMVTEAEKKN